MDVLLELTLGMAFEQAVGVHPNFA